MDSYGAIVRELAKRHGAMLVDTQAAFDRMLAHEGSAAFSSDRVHPNLPGHMVLARAFLEGIGLGVAGIQIGGGGPYGPRVITQRIILMSLIGKSSTGSDGLNPALPRRPMLAFSLLAGFLSLLHALDQAAEGYEDWRGFHLGIAPGAAFQSGPRLATGWGGENGS
jgi:hypothetical protein